MKIEKLISVFIFLSVIQTGIAQNKQLLGSWQSSDGSEVIFTPQQVTISGVQYKYTVQGGIMYVYDQYGTPYRYKYSVNGNSLQFNIPGVGSYTFTKKQSSQTSDPFGKIAGTAQQPAGGSELIGNWQAANGTITSFDRQNMTIAGDAYRYTVKGNIITVYDRANNTMVYKYQVKGNQLYLYVEGTGTYVLNKVEGQQTIEANQGNGTGGNPAANARLYGTFCSYSSSGYSGSSSYSTTRHVSFDGKGHYSYGSESSYSGNGDGYAGSDGGYSGTYKVQGNKVILKEPDGTQYVVIIFFVQDSGEITELKYDGTVYAKALCD